MSAGSGLKVARLGDKLAFPVVPNSVDRYLMSAGLLDWGIMREGLARRS